MTIPKSRADACFHFVIYAVVILFFLLAVWNLSHGEALAGSIIWIILVALAVREGCKEGGLRGFLVNRLGDVVGRRFIEADHLGQPPQNVRLGFECCGHRFMQRTLPIGAIESVEWSSGQATSFAKRDMNDWSVFIWFDHHDPAKAAKEGRRRKPDQDLFSVGSSTPKDRAEALGLELVAFLRNAGAELVPGGSPTCFVRREATMEEAQRAQP